MFVYDLNSLCSNSESEITKPGVLIIDDIFEPNNMETSEVGKSVACWETSRDRARENRNRGGCLEYSENA